jgi:IS5 family transposase
MHQIKKGNQWYYRFVESFAFGMEVPIGVDKDTGLIHSVEPMAANVPDITPAGDLLHGEETVVHTDASYQGIEKCSEMKGKAIGFQISVRPSNRRALLDTREATR